MLSDDAKRKDYDRKGLASLDPNQMADPAIVFAMIFGEGKFDKLCGTLLAVMQVRVDETQNCAGSMSLGLLCMPTEHILYVFSLRLQGHRWQVLCSHCQRCHVRRNGMTTVRAKRSAWP